MECTICDDAVTNPICVECLCEEIEEWLRETKPKLMREVKKVASFYKEMTPISTCILCGKQMSVCRHCFTKEVHEIIKEHPELEEDFLRQFDYGLTGY